MNENDLRQKWFTIGVAISLSAATFAKPMSHRMDEPWPTEEDPRLIAPMNYYLPKDLSRTVTRTKRVKQIPWTGSYYPSHSGSTAVRWRKYADAKQWPTGEDAEVFHYDFYSLGELAKMDPKRARSILKNLSAVEKLDVLAGNADDPNSSNFYKNTRRVRDWAKAAIKLAPEQMDFHGLCGGYSAAAIYLPEPQEYVAPITYRRADGSTVQFPLSIGSSDFKANASYYYARKTWNFNRNIYAGMIGSGGLNAGSFHVLLMSLVGDRGESFGVDTTVGSAVWNYPVVGFKTTVEPARPISVRGASREATQEVEVHTTVEYMGTSDPTGPAQGALSENNIIRYTYHYVLEITDDHRVVGGTWLSDSPRIDFAWKLKGPVDFDETGEFVDYGKMMQYWVAQPGD